MRTDLSSGAWIEYVPVQDLKGKHKRLLDRTTKMSLPAGAISDDGSVDVGALMGGLDMFAFSAAKQDALWALLIITWSYDELPVPQVRDGEVMGAESFDELPLDDYEEITALFAPHAEKLARRPDPKSLITSGSNGSSPARARGSRTG